MVTINFTLLVELGLFLIFLWGTKVLILSPMLRMLDEREALVAHNEEQTGQDIAEAVRLEERRLEEVSRLHREMDERFRDARRSAMNRRAELLGRERDKADREIEVVRAAANERVRNESADAQALAPGLAKLIASHLGIEGERS